LHSHGPAVIFVSGFAMADDGPDPSSKSKSLTRVAVRIAAAVIGLILLAIVLVGVVVNARAGLAFIAAAAFLAAALNHGVHWLEEHKFPRWAAISTVMAAIIGVMLGGTLLLVPAVSKQVRALIHNAPSIVASVRESSVYRTIDRQFNVTEQIENAQEQIPKALQRSLDPALKALGSVFSVAVGFVTIFFLTIFMLIFGGQLVEAALAEATPVNRIRYRRVLSKIYESIGGYLVGISLVCAVNATLTTTVLAILRVPFFLPLGILSGFSSLVPYAGPAVMATTVTVITLATSGLVKGIIVAVWYIFYGQIEGNVLAPVVFRRTVDVNPLIVLISLVIFGELAGIVGAIAAVPLAAMGQILVRELLLLRRQSLNLPLTGEAGSIEEVPQQEIKQLEAEDAASNRRNAQ
jgi:putative heme transporter